MKIAVSVNGPEWQAMMADPARIARRAVRAAFWAAPGALPAGSSEIGIVLSDNREVRKLNRKHRGKDKPTNVLSFPVEAEGETAGRRLLGDVVLARETVAREAALAFRPVENHFSHLVVHGILHLLGFDHETETDAERMEAVERAALAHLGMPDPYGVH